MSLRPQQPIPPVPDDTARIARAAFRRGNPYLHRPGRPDAAGPKLAGAGGGHVPCPRLRGGLGAPPRALPRGPREHDLGRIQGQHVRSTLHPRRLQPGRLPALSVAVALHACGKPLARAAAMPRARRDRGNPSAAGYGGGSAAVRSTPRRRGHDLGTISQGVRACGLRQAR